MHDQAWAIANKNNWSVHLINVLFFAVSLLIIIITIIIFWNKSHRDTNNVIFYINEFKCLPITSYRCASTTEVKFALDKEQAADVEHSSVACNYSQSLPDGWSKADATNHLAKRPWLVIREDGALFCNACSSVTYLCVEGVLQCSCISSQNWAFILSHFHA